MVKAVKCPVCGGTGKYTPPNDFKTTDVPQERTCHGCNGKGWVEIGSSDYPFYPIYPTPISPGYPYYPIWYTTTTGTTLPTGDFNKPT